MSVCIICSCAVGLASIAGIVLSLIYLRYAFWWYLAWVGFIDLLFAAFIYTQVFL